MKKILLLLLLIPTIALSQNINYSIKSSEDNDGVKTTSHNASFMFNNWGIGVSNTEYQTPLLNKLSSGIFLVSDYKTSNYNINGNIGVGKTDGTNYLLGDITGSYVLNKHAKLNVGLFGDIVDSTNSLNNNITFRGLTLGTDLEYNKFGITLGTKNIWYSNSNQQQGYYLKPFYSIVDGVTVYLTKKHYKNTNPYNGLYFSPDSYDRSGAGISIRKRVGPTTIIGFIENTRIKTPFSNDSTIAWKLNVVGPINNKLKIQTGIGQDYNNGFYYRYADISVNYQF